VRSVPIASIEVDSFGRLLVRPDTTDTQLFEYIYRAATGVRWRAADLSFLPDDIRNASPARWFEIILSSVHDELGIDLHISVTTAWISVSPDARQEMMSLAFRRAV
jgi:hypothetical protein